MKRLIPVIFSLLALTLNISVRAQSFEDQLKKAENIKIQYGETDDRYLEALSKAVASAFDEKNFEEANRLRLAHSEIVKGKYGENSLEYAEDMWRLGNVSEFKGEQYRFDCYKKTQRILESINAKDSFIYCNLFWQYFWHYWNDQKWLMASINMKKYIDYAKPLINKDWKGNMLTDIDLADAYYILGLVYSSKLNDNSGAVDAFSHCVNIIEENNLLKDFRDPFIAYQGVWLGYEALKDYKESIPWHLRSIAAAEQLKGDTSDEYLQELSSLRYCYFSMGDFENTEKANLALLDKIEKRDKQAGIKCETDSLYVAEYESLVSFCGAFEKDAEKIPYCKRLSEIYHLRGEQNTESYLDLLGDLILSYHNTGDFISAYSLCPEYEILAKELNLTESEKYYNYLGLKAEALTFLYRQDEYEQVLEQRKTLTSKLFGENSSQNIMQEFMIANQLMSLDKRSEAAIHLQNCFDIIESGSFAFEDDGQRYIIMASLHNLEGQIYTPTDPGRAETALIKAVEESRSYNLSTYAPLVNLGLLQYSIYRNPKTAVDYFIQAKDELEKIGDKTSINYITVLNDIGLCYQSLGMSSLAISIFDLVQVTAETVYGKQHPMYATILQNKTVFYANLTDYQMALKCAEEAAQCMEEIYGPESEKYALGLQNLGMIYQYVGKINESKESLTKAIPILERISPANACIACTNLLNIFAYEKDWDSFDATVHKCSDIIVQNHLEDTDVAVSLWGSVGYLFFLNDNPDAKKYLGYALNTTEKNGDTNSPRHFSVLLCYCVSLFFDGSQNEAIIPVLTGAYKNLYITNAVYYNSLEREAFVTSSRYSQVKNVIFTARSEGVNDSVLYDYLLFSKGLLLGTSLNYAKAIYDSGNDEIIAQYAELQELNKYINGEKTNAVITLTIDEAKTQSSVLERQLTLFLRQNSDYTDGLNYTYADVREALSSNSVAIEFVDYRNLLDQTDCIAALIAGKEWDTPRFVKLCKKTELEKLVSLSPDRLYGETTASEDAYYLIWAPLIPYLTNIKTVYFSPAGYINKLAIEHLYNGEKRFDAIYDVIRITSTREICGNKPQYKYTSAVLYGGLKYDEDDATMIAESRIVRGNVSSQPCIFRGLNNSVTRKGWEYLPGTLEEVNQISSIISKTKMNCDVYTSGKGNEESFKALSGNNFSILHIATHGFYMTESQAERNDFFASNPFAQQNAEVGVSPLQRSGLLLAGGNKAWKGEAIPEGVEDGVLTAAEISSLDLNRCDVVVLSACETGLGEITDEGVFGLQRAFKNAGVNTIIMSLWEVDDQATSLMMQTFYSNLVKGKSKRDSFFAAQNEVRKKYADPRYWAAFIMLD